MTWHSKQLTAETKLSLHTEYGSKLISGNTLVVAIVSCVHRAVDGQASIRYRDRWIWQVDQSVDHVVIHVPLVGRQWQPVRLAVHDNIGDGAPCVVDGANWLCVEVWPHWQLRWVDFSNTIVYIERNAIFYKVKDAKFCRLPSTRRLLYNLSAFLV